MHSIQQLRAEALNEERNASDIIVNRIAQVMIDLGDGATQDDLIERGFTQRDLAHHRSAAAAIARGRVTRQLEAK